MVQLFGRARDAYTELQAAQKPPHGVAAYGRFVNRPLGRLIAALAAAFVITPNAVTAISAGLSGAAILVLATMPASGGVAVAVAGLLCLGYAADSADGQVARLTKSGSARGEWLDHMVDCAKTSLLHLSVWRHASAFGEFPPWFVLLPLLYMVVANVTFFGFILTDLLRRLLVVGPSRATGSLSIARSIALLPGDYGFLCVSFVLLAWPRVFALSYALFFLANSVLLMLALRRWWRLLETA